MTHPTLTTTSGAAIKAAYLVNGCCRTSGIVWISVLVVWNDGSSLLVNMDTANKWILVNGVPVVDWYARQN